MGFQELFACLLEGTASRTLVLKKGHTYFAPKHKQTLPYVPFMMILYYELQCFTEPMDFLLLSLQKTKK